MKHRKGFVAALTAALVLGLSVDASLGLAASPSGLRPISGTASPAASNSNDPRVGAVASGTAIDFEVQLKLTKLGAAQAFATAVSTPGNAAYGKFLTPAQWEARFSPTSGQVAEVTAFLRSSGFTVLDVTPDRMAIDASGTAAQVERAFATSLAYYDVAGTKLRLASRDLSVPAALAGIVAGATGISQTVARPFDTTDNPAPATSGAGSAPPPAGFRVAPPCGSYYNQKIDTTLPPYGNGFPSDPPWATCGYTPSQFRSAYHLTGGSDGSGVTVAIVDAYAAPTLFSDAQKYASINDPSNPLTDSQFSELLAPKFTNSDLCGPSGWYGEQTLDVEAVHATAPGAHILFAGAGSCLDGELNVAVRNIVDHHLADVITNSYGDPAGDLLDPSSVREATDNTLIMAAGTGISVLFSSGDWEDNFTVTATVAPTFPASSPWATGVGGTTLKVNAAGERFGELGWSTARSYLCNSTLFTLGGCTDAQLGTWTPFSLALDGGSGGGTSFVYPQPSYQAGVVPASLSQANGPEPMRVEPDISMDADPATGMLVGETQTFPNGVYYDQYRIGGTSLSSPLLAGVIARADGTARQPLGFLNPSLYALYGHSGALYDILPADKQDESRADFANSIDDTQGFLYTTRIIDYEGQEEFCTDNGTCYTRDDSLHTAPGYDNMTGLGSPGEQFLSDLTGH
jgi:subtilase family serine protease